MCSIILQQELTLSVHVGSDIGPDPRSHAVLFECALAPIWRMIPPPIQRSRSPFGVPRKTLSVETPAANFVPRNKARRPIPPPLVEIRSHRLGRVFLFSNSNRQSCVVSMKCIPFAETTSNLSFFLSISIFTTRAMLRMSNGENVRLKSAANMPARSLAQKVQLQFRKQRRRRPFQSILFFI